MLEMKFFLLFAIAITCTGIGFLLAKKYKDRLKELKDLRLAMTILETKMKLTKEPIGHIFEEISNQLETRNIAQLFLQAADHMEYTTASSAWNESLTITRTNLTKEDIEMLRTFGKMLGKTRNRRSVKGN